MAKAAGGIMGGSTALATKTALPLLVGDWRGQGIAHAFTHLCRKKNEYMSSFYSQCGNFYPPTHFSVEVHSFFYFWRVWNENQMKKNFLLLKANIRKNLFYFCLSLFLLFPTVIAIIFSPWCFFSPLNKYVCFYSFNLIMYPSSPKNLSKIVSHDAEGNDIVIIS